MSTLHFPPEPVIDPSRRGQIGAAKNNVWLIILAVAALSFAGMRLFRFSKDGGVPDYPYWCSACKEVYSVKELHAPGKWRIAPGGPSDSVVVCIKCDKGWAYPATRCSECGTWHIIHATPDMSCPKCHPEVEASAKRSGIELAPKELND